ncbi:MAG: preprotein translocase subunit SecY [Christensenellales bacterium]
MFSTLVNAWKIKDIRTKMLYTMLLIVIYRLGSFIPVPGVNAAAITQYAEQYDMLGFLNLLSGGAFGDFSIFAMGISPYITGSIIIQLLTIAIPSLERLSKEEDGREKIEAITRYTGIGLALVQSIGIVAGLQNSNYGGNVLASTDNLFLTYATIGLVCTAGTAFLMWIGERITEKGIGNGVSFIIFASICARVPTVVLSICKAVFVTGQYYWWILPILIVFVLAIVTGVTFIDRSERRIPVQYAKRVVGRKMYGGQSTFIPLKANANGVMPLIFAMTIMQVPAMIGQFWPDGGFNKFYINYMSASSEHWYGHLIYYVIYSLLIVAFAYFYTTISFNPVEISKNLQQNGGFIPGIRPGRPTGEYLQRISNRLTLFGAIFLMILAIVPTVLLGAFGLSSTFGPTSILIMVSVALETSAQLESMMLMRHYKGFLG